MCIMRFIGEEEIRDTNEPFVDWMYLFFKFVCIIINTIHIFLGGVHRFVFLVFILF